MLNKYLSTHLCLLLLLPISNLLAQMTLIPDPVFEQVLIDQGFDSGLPNGQVLTANIQAITALDVNFQGISDLTGIEDMKDLITLDCSSNDLENLDLSGNSRLEELDCGNNVLQTLNVAQNFFLEKLSCRNNELKKLDLKQNFNLRELDAQRNKLRSLDLSGNLSLEILLLNFNDLPELELSNNTNLITLACGYNDLSKLKVNNNKLLESISCTNNSLTALSLSQNLELERLSCNDNKMVSLSTTNNSKLSVLACHNNEMKILNISQNKELEILTCCDNQLTELDASGLPKLRSISICSNALTCLNVQNGNNLKFIGFNAQGNYDLTCIQVDDPAYSISNWTKVDSDIAFEYSCDNACNTVGLKELETELVAQLFPNPSRSTVNVEFRENGVAGKWILYNQIGQEIETQTFEKSKDLQLDLELISGVYFLNVRTEAGHSKVFKFWRE